VSIKKDAKSIDTSSKAKIQASLKLLSGGNAGKKLEIKKTLIALVKLVFKLQQSQDEQRVTLLPILMVLKVKHTQP